MIDYLLHVLGLCHDSPAHIDLLEFFSYGWSSISDLVSYIYNRLKLIRSIL